jgi:AraC-like DNA-binding protein
MLAHARATGVDSDALLRELGLDRSALVDADARLPLALDRQLWARASARSDDPAFGLHVATRFDLGAFEALDYAMWASETLSEALDRVVRFHRLVGDDAGVRLERRRDRVYVVRDNAYDLPARSECLLAAIWLRARALVGRPLAARTVSFAHPAPADPRPYRAFFAGPVHFGAATTELAIDASALALPVESARPGLARVLDKYMHDLVARLPEPDSFVSRAEQAIARSLSGGQPSVAATARVLHASPRTVQRRLLQLGLTHGELVDRVRRALAERLFATPRLSLTEIAYLLGFRDLSGFYRAHRRWTGTTPSQRRRRAQG